MLGVLKLAFTSNLNPSVFFFQWNDKEGKLSGRIIYLKMTCVGLKPSKGQKEICYVLKAQGNVTCKSNLTSKTFVVLQSF